MIILALADQLSRVDLEKMLTSYADVVRMQAILTERELDHCRFAEQSSPDKVMLFDLIRENILSFYASELEWIEKVKSLTADLPDGSISMANGTKGKHEH